MLLFSLPFPTVSRIKQDDEENTCDLTASNTSSNSTEFDVNSSRSPDPRGLQSTSTGKVLAHYARIRGEPSAGLCRHLWATQPCSRETQSGTEWLLWEQAFHPEQIWAQYFKTSCTSLTQLLAAAFLRAYQTPFTMNEWMNGIPWFSNSNPCSKASFCPVSCLDNADITSLISTS